MRWVLFLIVISTTVHADRFHCFSQTGIASHYDARGEPHACGKKLAKIRMSAAHKFLPCGTRVKVINPETRRAVMVTITDRGPFIPGRIIDLSEEAFSAVDGLRKGLFRTKIRFCLPE